MSSLAGNLEGVLQKPVINETGLTNGYDFQLLWNEKESGGTELARVLHEQLGLELAPARKPIDLLVATVATRRVGESENRMAK